MKEPPTYKCDLATKVNTLGVKEGTHTVIDLLIAEACLTDTYGDHITEVCGSRCTKGDPTGGLPALYICSDKVSYCTTIIEAPTHLFDKTKCDSTC